jgi:hypothetical protein
MNSKQAKAIRRAYRDYRAGKAPSKADTDVMQRLLDAEGNRVVRVVNREHQRIGAGAMVAKLPWSAK